MRRTYGGRDPEDGGRDGLCGGRGGLSGGRGGGATGRCGMRGCGSPGVVIGYWRGCGMLGDSPGGRARSKWFQASAAEPGDSAGTSAGGRACKD